MTTPKIDHTTTTNTADMARTLSISDRHLQQLAADGWVDGRVGRDRWNVFRTIATYLNYCAHKPA